MNSIINYLRMLFRHRKYQRFSVESGTFVIVSPGTDRERMVHVIDISMGGAAFIYKGSPEELDASGVLKMLTEAPGLAKVCYDTVSDRPTSEPFRRRSVKFKWLGVLEQVQMKSFIKEIGIVPK